MKDADCIFCKIAGGAIPSATIRTTDSYLAFLDIAPLAEGHTLVIPKSHFSTVNEMDGPTWSAVVRELPAIAAAVVKATGAEGWNLLQNNGRSAGQVVPHVHFHIIPRHPHDGLGFRWNAGTYSPGREEEIRTSIQSALNAL